VGSKHRDWRRAYDPPTSSSARESPISKQKNRLAICVDQNLRGAQNSALFAFVNILAGNLLRLWIMIRITPANLPAAARRCRELMQVNRSGATPLSIAAFRNRAVFANRNTRIEGLGMSIPARTHRAPDHRRGLMIGLVLARSSASAWGSGQVSWLR